VLGVVCGVFRPFWEQEPAPTIVPEDAATLPTSEEREARQPLPS
jgi:hypothetical protein